MAFFVGPSLQGSCKEDADTPQSVTDHNDTQLSRIATCSLKLRVEGLGLRRFIVSCVIL